MRRRPWFAAGFAVVALLLARAPSVRAEDEAAEEVKAALVAAAEKKDPRALGNALAAADALVGPSATFPDQGALADWLGTMPDAVTRIHDVALRRGWLYVSAGKRGEDAIPPLEAVLKVDPKHAAARSYLGEARRQAGDVDGAVADLLRALADGASDDHVLPSVRKLVFDLHKAVKPGEGEGLPRYVVVAQRFLAVRAMPDQRQALVLWLAYEADLSRRAPKRAALFRTEAVRQVGALVAGPPADLAAADLARTAYDAAGWVTSLGADRPADLPERFDLLAAAVRLGETPEPDRHEVPEALAALAEESLARGRYVLAAALARRRLGIGDSPAARRVLLASPPDVGD